ncbi:hypothetical protein HYW83_02845 [Candidatus Peregrinibacteria bacterium]|nr:hypothetical protein [Candidatus Peregrinibacteria bacterium]
MDRYQKLLSEKAKCKRELIGKMFFPRTPVLLIDLSGVEKIESFKDLLKGLESIHLTTLILGVPHDAEMPIGKFLHYLPDVSRDSAFRAADFVIMQDGNPDTVRERGCVPISQLDGDGTLDYNPLREKGNGFYFKNPTKWEMFAAIVRAAETYQFPYDWENLVREILK